MLKRSTRQLLIQTKYDISLTKKTDNSYSYLNVIYNLNEIEIYIKKG